MTRDAENWAERHMLKVWWIRVVSMATGWDEDSLATLANVTQHYRDSVRCLDASAAWVEWLPDEWRGTPLTKVGESDWLIVGES